MAINGKVPRHGPVLTGAFLVGLLLVFIGQRIIGESGLTRTLLDGVGAALCVGALIVRLINRGRIMELVKKAAEAERAAARSVAQVELATSVLYGLGLLALGLYGLATPAGLDVLGIRETPLGEEFGAILGGFWMALLACSLLPLLFIELSYAGMPAAGAVELRRIHLSGAAGLTLGFALTYLMALNYAATEYEVRRDLSYFRVTAPSESSIGLVKRLDQDVEVVLFYPETNEVLDQLRPYFDELATHSKHLKVSVRDHVLAPALAKEHRVRGNGHVLILRGEQGKTFPVGTELESARRKLRTLDGTFQENFTAVTQPERFFYTTMGHGERTDRSSDQPEGAGINSLATFVRQLGMRHRNLGLSQGLASQVPEDASVVAVVGPTTELLPEEVASLRRWVEAGGRLLLLLETNTSAGLDPVLETLGLRLEPGVLAHEEHYRLLTDTSADRASIVSNRYSSHPSVTTCSRGANHGIATVFFNAGHISERRGSKARVNVILRSMPGTWADRDGDLTYDEGQEDRMTYSIGAAVTLPVEGAEEGEARAIVLADADVFSDRVLRNEGNLWLAADTIRWLIGEESVIGAATSEEDEVIEHSRNQDALWFWATVFLVPIAVLGFGLFFTLSRRRRRTAP
jgi:hypothetical protein